MDDLNSLWNKVLGEIEIEVSKASFLTLFKKTSLVSLEESVATVAAPSSMIIDLLKRRYSEIIKKVFDKQTGLNIKLVFIPKVIINESAVDKTGPLFAKTEDVIKKTIGHLPRVRPDFTFENLAVSSSNQLAYVSATTVSKKLGKAYNPLFIYGPVGVGKTHLMQAIANDVYNKNPDKKIIYLTSEEFTNEVVDAIRTNTTNYLKRKFRNIDLLIIDDIQFVAGKEKVQEELFHTFNVLVDNEAQIALSSDRPPSEIKKVEKRLLSRFAGGLTVDIESPDFELRTAILLIKAAKHAFNLPIEYAKMVAEKTMDARQIEGVLLRIITETEAGGGKIEEAVNKVLSINPSVEEKRVRPDDLILSVCDYYKLKPTQLKGVKRDAFLVRARHVTMYLLKKELGLTLVEIGNLLGGRDHTTIMHGVEKVESMSKDPLVKKEILGIVGLKRAVFVD